MNQVLTKILENTRKDLNSKKASGNFSESLLNPKSGNIAIIAEIKLASPTVKNLGAEKKILSKAVEYEKAGADAVSFITEKSVFKGNVEYIPQIKSKVKLPLLHKDFVIDPYQIYESKIMGSNALLLIAKILEENQLAEFVDLCLAIGLEPVVEINDEQDLKKAIKTKTKMIAVNARNLDTLKVDLGRAVLLMKKIPDFYLKLGFSGISSNSEVKKYKSAGVKAVLVGTSLMKASNSSEFLKGLR